MANPVLPGGLGSPQAIYETSLTQYHAVGERGILSDRSFRYSRVIGTAINTNVLCQQPAAIANHTTETGTLTGFTAGRQDFTAALGATAATLNQYENGYIKIQSSTLGAGQIYKLIGGHGAVASSGTISLRTEYPIVTTPTGTVTWSLVHNPWADIIVTPVTTQTGISVGVPLVAIPVGTSTAPVFAWVQTWGVCSVLGDTTNTVVGSGLHGQGATAGTVSLALETTVTMRVGASLESLSTDDVYQSVFLQIAP